MNVLMGLYGRIESDGRVHRSIKALRDEFDVTIFAHCEDSDFFIDGVNIIKRRVDIFERNKKLEQVLYNLKLIWIGLKMKPDVFYAHDFYLPFSARLIQLYTGAKVVYDAHELIIPSPNAKIGFRAKLFYILEKLTVRRFQLILTANEERATVMQQSYNLKSRPLPVLNIIEKIDDSGLISQKTVVEQVPILGDFAKDSILFVYQGVVMKKRRIDLIIDKVARLKNAQILIIGGGDLEYISELKNHCLIQGFHNVSFLSKVPLKTLYSILKICHYGIISYANVDLNNTYCAPNKLYEYAYFELPMVTSSQELFHKTFEEYPMGIVLSQDFETFEAEFKMLEKRRNKLSEVFLEFGTRFNFENESKKLLKAVEALFQ